MDRDTAEYEPILEEDEIGANSHKRQEAILLSYCHHEAFDTAQKIIKRINELEPSVSEACLYDFLLEAFFEKHAKGINHNAELNVVEDFISVIPDRLLTVDNFTKILCLVHLSSIYSSFFSCLTFAFSGYVNKALKMNSFNITQQVIDKYFSFVCQKISERKPVQNVMHALQMSTTNVFSKDFLGLRLVESEDKKVVEELLAVSVQNRGLSKAVRQIITLLYKTGDLNFKACIREPWFKFLLEHQPGKAKKRLLYYLERIFSFEPAPCDFKKLICLVHLAQFNQYSLPLEFVGINALFDFLLKKCRDPRNNSVFYSVEELVQYCDQTFMGKIENEAESFSEEDKLNKEEAEKQKNDYEEDLICPITQDLLQYPVTTSNGHAFEEKALENWIQEKSLKVDPLDNKQFDSYVSDVLIKKVLTAIHNGYKITEKYFYCPLSVQQHEPKIIEKPVIDLKTGITYDEKNYLSWCEEKTKTPNFVKNYTVEKILTVFKALEPESEAQNQTVLPESTFFENPASFFGGPSSDQSDLWRNIYCHVRAFVDKQWTYHTGISQILELKISNPVSYVQQVQGICKRRLQDPNNSRNAFYRAASVHEFYELFKQYLTLSANATPALLNEVLKNLRNLNQKYDIDCSLPQGISKPLR